MTTIDTLRSLQQRIREATGPDRELDLAISETFDHWRKTPLDGLTQPPPRIARFYTTDPDGLGACVALQRQLLPDAYFDVSRTSLRPGMIPGSSPFKFRAECGNWGTPCSAHHDSMVCAALLAIIAARISELEAKEKTDAI